MAFTVIVRDEAFGDAIEAYLYYEEKQTGLGERFLSALNEKYLLLADNPNNYSVLAADKKRVLRDVKIKDFPYVIIFETTAQNVFVYAVHNTYKDTPVRLKARLRKR